MASVKWNVSVGMAKIDKEGAAIINKRGRAIIDAAKAGMRKASGITTKTLSKKKVGTRARAASEPGGSPAIQTGRTYRGFKIKKMKRNRWRVTNTDQKSNLLEFGTKRMRSRPFMKNAIREVFGSDAVISFEKKARNP